MKTVTLQKLELTNYRNIDHAVFEFDGNSKIVGENRIGKTNTLESIYWLLTDKLLGGSSDIAAIKPISDTKKQVEVEGTFEIYDPENPQIMPKLITLKKVYAENWAKVRGTQDMELKGHYTEWFYNGVKQGTFKAYQSLFNTDFGIKPDFSKIEIIRLLIDPTYLGELGESKDWTELRNFIINLIGDVKDDDVFAANPKLMPIKDDLFSVNGRTDQLKKQYKNIIDGLNDSIIGNQAQLSMLQKLEKPSDEDIAIARKAIEEIDDRIAKLQNAKTIDAMSVTLQSRINDLEKQKNDIVASLIKNDPLAVKEKAVKDKMQSLSEDLRKTRDENWRLAEEISHTKTEIYNVSNSILGKNNLRDDLISKLKELDALIKNINSDTSLTTCPTCHRPLENAEELIASRKAEYLKEKQDLITKGKENTEELKLEKIKLEGLESELATLTKESEDLAIKIENLNDQIAELRKEENALFIERQTSTPTSPELEALNKEIAELYDRLDATKENTNKRESEIRAAIAEEAAKKEPYGKVLTSLDYYEMQKKQIGRVEAELNENKRKLASYEQRRELVNSFIFLKLKMLDERVESVFGHIRFQLISMNLNGGYDAICKPYIYDIDNDRSTDVTWKSGSKSEKIITGIAIAEKIKAKLELPNFPFLFDEGGEISSDTFATKFQTESQLICVKVQDNINKPIVLKI